LPYLTTGLIDNTSTERGKQAQRLLVEISNEDTSNVAVQIDGFFRNGTQKVKYVDEFFTLSPGTVDQRDYYSLYDAFEFQFFVSSQLANVLVRGKDAAGNFIPAYQIISSEIETIFAETEAEQIS
jgi:hypothetical protein